MKSWTDQSGTVRYIWVVTEIELNNPKTVNVWTAQGETEPFLHMGLTRAAAAAWQKPYRAK